MPLHAPLRPPLHRRPRLAFAGALLLGVAGIAGTLGCGGSGGGGGGTPADCGGDGGGGCVAGTGTPMTVSGVVRYERLVLAPAGLGPALELRPARFVDVEVRVAGAGPCFGSGSTDATGAYSVVVAPPAGSTLEVVAWSRTDYDPLRNVTVHEGLAPLANTHCNGNVFRRASASFPSGASRVVDITVPYNPGTSQRPSIGFGTLDVLAGASEAIRTATGTVPPICHAYTLLGNNGAVGTSYYDSGADAITILGGAAGALDASDTDYFDDGVLAHEYHHFVEFRLAHSLNRGGGHGGEDLEPPFAWSEGMCTGFGCLARGTSLYLDTQGTNGSLLFGLDVENILQFVRGIGGEETVAEIVWDVGDGANGIPDPDGDGVALALSQLYGALLSFSPTADAPYLGLFLDRLVTRGSIGAPPLTALMTFPENQQVTFPPVGGDVWPLPLALPGNATGRCDATVPNPCRARLASAWYLLTLAAADVIDVTLDVQPIAGVPNGNLDLSVLDIAGNVLRRSATAGTGDEAIQNLSLPAGRYLVLVEANCSGFGNRADYSLVVN